MLKHATGDLIKMAEAGRGGEMSASDTPSLIERLRKNSNELKNDGCWALHYSEPEGKLWEEAANDTWCKADFVPELCKTIRGMNENQLNTIVYNGRDKTSRDLANWWEEHEAADRAREAQERKEAEEKALAQTAMQKISKEELAALKKWVLK